ncbi:MAG TPA: DUF998 domain-containing protein [Thermoplasmata archaeon]
MAVDQSPPPVYTVSERYGPRVHRSVRHGAILLLVGALQFIGAMVLTQIGYGSSYSLTGNYISDLGAVNCGVFGGAGSFAGHYACSPWHDVFNVSIVVMGLFVILAAILIRTAFPARRSRMVGLWLLALAGVGSIGVGLSPEDYYLPGHVVSALLAFVGGGLALFVLGFAMFRDTRWEGFRAYTVLSGLIVLVALLLFVSNADLGLGVGGMERLIVAPVLLWSIVAGTHLARIPTFAPRAFSKGSTE